MNKLFVSAETLRLFMDQLRLVTVVAHAHKNAFVVTLNGIFWRNQCHSTYPILSDDGSYRLKTIFIYYSNLFFFQDFCQRDEINNNLFSSASNDASIFQTKYDLCTLKRLLWCIR